MAQAVKNLSGNKLMNFTNGSMMITSLVERIDIANPDAVRPIEMHSIEVAIIDSGVELPISTIKAINREINDIFNTHGDYSTSTSGNQVMNEKTIDVNFGVDCNFFIKEEDSVVQTNNVLFNMATGNSYKLTDENKRFMKDTRFKVIGTNGTTKRSALCETDLDFGGLFWRDGMLINPQASDELGSIQLTENTRINAYNNYNVCVMLEFVYRYTSQIKVGFRFPYCSIGEPSMSEGDDYNRFNFTAQVLCDSRETNKPMIEGISQYEDKKYAVNGEVFVGTNLDDIKDTKSGGSPMKKQDFQDCLLFQEITDGSGEVKIITSGEDVDSGVYGGGIKNHRFVFPAQGVVQAQEFLIDETALSAKEMKILTTRLELENAGITVFDYDYTPKTGDYTYSGYAVIAEEVKPVITPAKIPNGIGIVKMDDVAKGYKKGQIVFGSKYEDQISKMLDKETGLLHGDYVKVYLDSVYDFDLNKVLPKTKNYLLGKVNVDIDGTRTIYGVVELIKRDGTMVGLEEISITPSAKEFLIGIYDWDYGKMTQVKK